MDNQNENPIDPIAFLKKAKPAEASSARVEHLFQKSELKVKIRYRKSLAPNLKLALIAAPTIVLVLAAYAFNSANSQPKLSLELSGFSDVHKSSIPNGQASVTADCLYSNRLCNDVGYRSDLEIEWKYTLSSNLSNEAYPGQVFALAQTGRAKEIAEILVKEFGLPEPIKEVPTKYSLFTEYKSGSYKDDKEVRVMDRGNATRVSFENRLADRWYSCEHFRKEAPNCDSVKYKEMPNEAEAVAESIRLFSLLGIHSGTNMAELKDGDYFIKYEKQNFGVGSVSYPILNGQAAALPFEIYWNEGSNEISNFFGGLYTFENKGLFNTISAKKGVDRLNVYRADPSVTEGTFKLSSSRLDGMPPSEQYRLFEESQKLPKGTPIVLDVTITRAIDTFVTIYDANYKAWVVPGISYFDDTGYLGSITSLDSDYIQMDAKESIKSPLSPLD